MPKFNTKNIQRITNNKPVVYTLKDKNGNLLYVGSSGRGELQNRLKAHQDKIPATDFTAHQYPSIKDARKAEDNKIKREKPKYNKLNK